MRDEYTLLLDRLFRSNLFCEGRDGPTACKSVLESLGRPDKVFDSIQVGGSNGKGSVATKLATALRLSGKKVGLFTSPHIEDFRERIQVDGEMISKESVIRYLKELFSQEELLTFFDTTTLLALLYFAEKKVDVAVLEVGLGGRLDATMVVDPILSVITSISLEHTAILGNSIEEIAKEKAGIIRPGVPSLIGPTVPQEIVQATRQVTEQFSDFEEENRAIASAACQMLGIPEEGLTALPPCRMEELVPGVILDVAHNPEAIKKLLARLRHLYPDRKIRVVVGFARDKNVQECLQILRQEVDALHLVKPNHERALDPSLLGLPFDEPKTAIAQALLLAKEKSEILLICGSFYLMQDAILLLESP